MRKYTLATLFFLISFSFPRYAHAAACPNQGDTKIFVNPTNNLCYSETDPLYNTGFNTIGGALSTCGTGGQVRCPGSTTNLPNGNLCIVKNGNQCFAGYGTSGVNTPGCTIQGGALGGCPKPLNLTIKAVDPTTQKGLPYVDFTITYEDSPSPTNYVDGKKITISSDTNGATIGQAVVAGLLYSGDHFSITASSKYYNITPNQIGNLTNIGQYEMNTTFSCGTQLENGQNNPPCTFTGTSNGVPLPNSNQNSGSTTIPDDSTVSSALDSVNKTLLILGAVGIVGVVVIGVGGGGKV